MEQSQQSQLILNGGARVVLDDPQDYTASLYEVVDNYRRNLWIKPEHQRDFVWGDEKVKAWIDRLALAVQERPRKPVGVIVTYQLNDGNPSPTFINDGSQRIRATLQVLQEPATFGYDIEKAEAIIRAIRIPVQHRWYADQDAALEDFQLLNMGTSLTPREMCKGILANHPQYRLGWEPLFEQLHSTMRTIGGGLVQESGDNRRQKHKFERHDFSLIVRWLSLEVLVDYRSVAAMELRKQQIDNNEVIEADLRRVCDGYKMEDLRREIGLLVGHIQRQTALYREVWEQVRPELGKAISPTLFRWLMDISIWVRKAQIPTGEWELFVRALLNHTQGTSVVQDPNDMRNRVTLALGSVGKLKSVCAIIGSPLYAGKQHRRTRKVAALPGFDQSHVQPFATHGDGPTVLESAARNRARGAKPIDGD